MEVLTDTELVIIGLVAVCALVALSVGLGVAIDRLQRWHKERRMQLRDAYYRRSNSNAIATARLVDEDDTERLGALFPQGKGDLRCGIRPAYFEDGRNMRCTRRVGHSGPHVRHLGSSVTHYWIADEEKS